MHIFLGYLLPSEYENFVTLLLKRKKKLDGNEIMADLINKEFQMENKREQMGESINSPKALFKRD